MQPKPVPARCHAHQDLTDKAQFIMDEVLKFLQEAAQTLETLNRQHPPTREIPGQLVVLDGYK